MIQYHGRHLERFWFNSANMLVTGSFAHPAMFRLSTVCMRRKGDWWLTISEIPWRVMALAARIPAAECSLVTSISLRP